MRRRRPSRVTTPRPRCFSSVATILARQRYLEARERAGSFLRTKIDYALGNTALAEGDIPGAIRSYDECVASTAQARRLEAVRRDAAINRRFALEQQQSLAVPQDDSSGDQSKSPNSDRRKGPDRQGKGDDQSPEGQPESDPGSGGIEPGGRGRSRPSPRRPAPDGRGGRWTDGASRSERRLARRPPRRRARTYPGRPETGVSPMKIRRSPPTTTARIGDHVHRCDPRSSAPCRVDDRSDLEVRHKIFECGVVGVQADPVGAIVVINMTIRKIVIETRRAHRSDNVLIVQPKRSDDVRIRID